MGFEKMSLWHFHIINIQSLLFHACIPDTVQATGMNIVKMNVLYMHKPVNQKIGLL